MFRSIIWYLKFALSLIGTIPSMIMVNIKRKNPKTSEQLQKVDDYIFNFVSNWSLNRIKDSGATINVIGEENIPDEPVLFVSNHQSNFDIALFLSYIKTKKGFVAKLELLKVPILNKWMSLIDCVFIDRSSPRNSIKAISDATKLLKAGRSMVIFPEGTRSKSNNIGDFKGGSLKIATKARAKIVPVTIDGSFKIMEENNNKITPATVNMYIHKAIDTKDLSKEEEDKLTETIKSIISSKLPIK